MEKVKTMAAGIYRYSRPLDLSAIDPGTLVDDRPQTGPPTSSTRWEWWSPKGAFVALKRNHLRQRNLSGHNIEHMLAARESGTWYPNGEVIIFDTNGDVVDGQNRLRMIVASQKGEWLNTVRNVPADDRLYASIDQGKSRNLANLFESEGVSRDRSTPLAAAVRLAFELLENEEFPKRTTRSNPELESWFKNGNAGILTALEAVNSLKTAGIRRIFGSVAPALYYVFTVKTDSPMIVQRFFSELIDYTEWFIDAIKETSTVKRESKAEPSYPSSVKELAKRLVRAKVLKQKTSSLSQITEAAIMIKSFNAYFTDTEMTSLKMAKNEQFPSVATSPHQQITETKPVRRERQHSVAV